MSNIDSAVRDQRADPPEADSPDRVRRSTYAVLAVALVMLVTITGVAAWAWPHDDTRPVPAPATAAGQAPPVGPATATVTVDANADLGALNNPADYQNQSGPAWILGPRDLQKVDAIAPRVVRAWFKPHHYYDDRTDEYDFGYPTESKTTTYQYLDQVAEHGQEIFGNFDQCDQKLMRLSDPTRCRQVLKTGLKYYKQRYGSLRYIELFNEPDKTWEPNRVEQPAIDVEDYYRWYQIGYSIVREVNAELQPTVPLEIGGPSSHTFNTEWMTKFLDLYRDDPSPDKKLSFLSYHQYKKRQRPAEVAGERDEIREWFVERGLDAQTPVFVTEYGVFPGPNTGTTFAEDLLTQAAAMATLGQYYTYSGTEMIMHWTYNHLDNERKSMLVDEVDGAVYPYYNVVAMQRMLRSRLLPARSDALTEAGLGVNALATKDDGGIAVLLTNYQWTDGTDDHTVGLRVTGLPAALANRELEVQRYLVDSTTSNFAHDREHPELQRVEQYRSAAGTSIETTFPLGRNAVSLLILTPAGG